MSTSMSEQPCSAMPCLVQSSPNLIHVSRNGGCNWTNTSTSMSERPCRAMPSVAYRCYCRGQKFSWKLASQGNDMVIQAAKAACESVSPKFAGQKLPGTAAKDRTDGNSVVGGLAGGMRAMAQSCSLPCRIAG